MTDLRPQSDAFNRGVRSLPPFFHRSLAGKLGDRNVLAPIHGTFCVTQGLQMNSYVVWNDSINDQYLEDIETPNE